MSKRPGSNKDSVHVIFVSQADFHEARFIPSPKAGAEASLVLTVQCSEKARVDNLSFRPFDALKMCESMAMALQTGGCDGIERIARALVPSIPPQLPLGPIDAVAIEDNPRKEAADTTSDPACPRTIAVVPVVFLATVFGEANAEPRKKFVAISLARATGAVEQYAMEPHEALMLAEALTGTLAKFGSHEARRMAKSIRERVR
jgi:hypothetical protein